MVSNHVSHAFKLKVESRGVTVAEWVVLRSLLTADKNSHPSRLAETLGLTRGAVSKLVDRLVAKKLVTTREERQDRRFQTVQLTAAGKKLVPELAALADANDAEFFSHLTSKERARLVATLQEIIARRDLTGTPTD
jgi:DNA-binding MarR family transcriptional regulator